MFDPVRSYAYVSSDSDSSLYVIDVKEREIVASFAFDLRPGVLALQPDGAYLYLALWTHEHPFSFFDPPDHAGVIAVINPDEWVLEDTLVVEGQDPYDITVSDDGYLYVTGVLDRSTAVAGYDLASGERIGSDFTFFPANVIKLHPSQNRIYGVKNNNPSTIERWSVDAGAVMRDWHSSDLRGDSGRVAYGNLFISPLGDRIVSPIGKIFISDESEQEDLRYLRPLFDVSQGLPDPMTDLWFDVGNSALFALFDEKIDYFNLATFQQVGSFAITGTGLALGGHADSLVVARMGGEDNVFFDYYPNPMLGASANTPPLATFTVDPPGGTNRDLYTFDASGVLDAETSTEALRVRWDWDSDGRFDTSYDSVKVATHMYTVPGVKRVMLEVSDAFSLTDTLFMEVDVEFEADPGLPPAEAHIPYEAPYAFEHTAFDVQRRYAYLTAREEQKIAFMNLRTGSIEKEFFFPAVPELTFITPDSAHLYAGFRLPEGNPNFSNTRRGLIAVFDLDAQETIHQFWIDLNPSQLAAYNDEYVYVNGVFDVGILTEVLKSYRVRDGAIVDEVCCMGAKHILVTPEEDRMYGSRDNLVFIVETDNEGEMILRNGQDDFIRLDIQERFYLNPAGTRAITDLVEVYRVSPDPGQDFQFIQTLEDVPYSFLSFGTRTSDVFFDTINEVVLVQARDSMATYDAESYALLGKNPLPGEGSGLATTADSMYVVIESEQRIYAFPHPAPGGVANTPPVAAFTVAPDSGLADTDVFTFDSSPSSDLESSGSELEARWDWHGDGRFDTPFEPLGVVERTFARPAPTLVTLQVRDPLLLTNTASKTIQVVPVSNESAPDTPAEFMLYPNYPNPFRDRTSFQLSLPRPSPVRFDIYDVTGAHVARLIDRVLSSGEHTIDWLPHEELASGVYFVRVQTGEGRAETINVLRLK